MSGLLAFHAHPDDEATSTGGTLAHYADAGERVVVITATDGAVGEIHNYDDPEELLPQLAEMRAVEMAKAAAILGVEHEFLGYRDSGMMGTEDNDHPDCFWQADFMEATGRLVRLIRKYQPDVMVIYDPFGGYGHPDHIQVHRVGLAAFYAASDLSRFPLVGGEIEWTPPKLYWTAWARSRMAAFAEARHEAGLISAEDRDRMQHGGTADEYIHAWVDIRPQLDRKFDALRAHRTQIPADWWLFQVPEELRPEIFGRESFIRVFSRIEVPTPEDDLFAGLR